MKFARSLCQWMFVVLLFGAVATAQSVLTDDAFTSPLTPKVNYGDSSALFVGEGTSTYLKFSLANLPSGITGGNISGANVLLYVDAVFKPGTMDVYAVNAAWSEDNITYNTPPSLGPLLLSAVPVSDSGYLSLNLTSTVQQWLNNPSANNGIALVPSAGSPIWVSFDSKENILTSHAAQLNLVLVSAGPQGIQGVQGPAGPAGPQGATGTTGAQGPAGPAGATGAVGPIGPMGLQGATGSAGAAGPAGQLGPTGPQGPIGPAGSGGGVVSGIQEFTQTGTFTPPAGVTRFLVQIWGAGGGAGGEGRGSRYDCGLPLPCPCPGSAGGGGGSGAYSLAVISVTPGTPYNLVVGSGGQAGGIGTNGSAGGDSQVLDGSSGNILADSGGGQGGTTGSFGDSSTGACVAGPIGQPGAGGSATSGPNVIGRSGNSGSNTDVSPSIGSAILPPSVGNGGGSPGTGPKPGGNGYILLSW